MLYNWVSKRPASAIAHADVILLSSKQPAWASHLGGNGNESYQKGIQKKMDQKWNGERGWGKWYLAAMEGQAAMEGASELRC